MARMIDAGSLRDNITDIYGGSDRLIYLADVLSLIDAQSTLTPPNEWASVEEGLPEPVFNGQQRGFYLVALSNGTVKELMYEFRHYENMMFDVGWHETAYPVTHWMSLPAPPDRRPPEGEEDT